MLCGIAPACVSTTLPLVACEELVQLVGAVMVFVDTEEQFDKYKVFPERIDNFTVIRMGDAEVTSIGMKINNAG